MIIYVFPVGMIKCLFLLCLCRCMSICEFKLSDMFEVPDVDIIRPCGVVVFALFYCLLDLGFDECYCRCL